MISYGEITLTSLDTVSSVVVTYQIGTSGTTPPTGTWSSSVPTASPGQFLWTKAVTSYGQGKTTTTYNVSKYGENGSFYKIQLSTNIILIDANKTVSPSSFTATAYYINGKSKSTVNGYFKVMSGTTQQYKSSSAQSSCSLSYTGTTVASSYDVSFYLDSALTNMVDKQTVTVIYSSENLQIGGRNLFLNTTGMTEANPFTVSSKVGDNPVLVFLNGQRIYCERAFKAGDIITVQAKCNAPFSDTHVTDSSADNKVGFLLGLCSSLQNAQQYIPVQTPFYAPDISGTTVFTKTITLPSVANCPNGIFICFRFNTYGNNSTVRTYKLWDVKLQLGNVATDWSPAPEDAENHISTVETATAAAQTTANNASSAAGAAQSSANAAMDKANAVESRGEQLIINGTGILGNNTNFSSFTYDPINVNGNAGSFLFTSSATQTRVTDSFIPFTSNTDYVFEFDAKSRSGTSRMYSYIDCYDIDKKRIESQFVNFMSGTTTKLTQDLNKGDTVIHVQDASVFVSTSNHYRRGIIAWDYANSTGYVYPKETYSAHCQYNMWTATDTSAFDTTANTITCEVAWNGATVKAGTYISQSNRNNSYIYIGTENTIIPTNWNHYSGTINSNELRYGTAFIKAGWYLNYNKVPNETQWIANVSLKTDYNTKITAAQSTADTAKTNAATAQTTANTALTSANGKNRCFFGATQPTGTFINGDTWFCENGTSSKIMTYNSTTGAWEQRHIGTTTIPDATITSAKIASLDAGKITTGILDAGKITVKNLIASTINTVADAIPNSSNGQANIIRIDDKGMRIGYYDDTFTGTPTIDTVSDIINLRVWPFHTVITPSFQAVIPYENPTLHITSDLFATRLHATQMSSQDFYCEQGCVHTLLNFGTYPTHNTPDDIKTGYLISDYNQAINSPTFGVYSDYRIAIGDPATTKSRIVLNESGNTMAIFCGTTGFLISATGISYIINGGTAKNLT